MPRLVRQPHTPAERNPHHDHIAQDPARLPPTRKQRTIGCITVLAFAILLVVVILVVAGGGGSGGPKAAWKAHVQNHVVINPADLAVTVRVTNTGKAAGTPTCTVQAQDPSGAYTGVDVATLTKPIAAGAFGVYVDNVTITSQGAQYVTQVTVSCTA